MLWVLTALIHQKKLFMQQELIRIEQTEQKSIIFVTHNLDEALILGQRIVLMKDGLVERELDLSPFAYPRDLLQEELIGYKKEITAFFHQAEEY